MAAFIGRLGGATESLDHKFVLLSATQQIPDCRVLFLMLGYAPASLHPTYTHIILNKENTP